MTTDTHDSNKSTEAESSNLPGVVRGSLERVADGEIGEAAALVRRLETAQRFDDAEARALAERPELLEGGPALGAHRYLVTGDGEDEWISSGYTVAVGFDGGDRA